MFRSLSGTGSQLLRLSEALLTLAYSSPSLARCYATVLPGYGSAPSGVNSFMMLEAERYGIRHDTSVVESQRRQCVEREPPCFDRIIATNHPGPIVEQREVCRRDRPSTRIATRVAIHADELECAAEAQTSLLGELTSRSIFGTLSLISKATGKCPPTREWLVTTTDEQHMADIVDRRESDDIGSERRAWIAIFDHESSVAAHRPWRTGQSRIRASLCGYNVLVHPQP